MARSEPQSFDIKKCLRYLFSNAWFVWYDLRTYILNCIKNVPKKIAESILKLLRLTAALVTGPTIWRKVWIRFALHTKHCEWTALAFLDEGLNEIMKINKFLQPSCLLTKTIGVKIKKKD